ncbi:MAG TPA: Nif11-like leader peptide family natural product precursor [Candidatus Acidoferrum sp.]|jgi:hypothetical protein|nr:Nif11-like leader peptide family natural product precursor [Candidatus Acidoferrum sp.]
MELETSTKEFASRSPFERFAQLVLEDGEVHKTLREAPDAESFIALAVELGRTHGCPFTAETVRSALQEKRREWLQRWL